MNSLGLCQSKKAPITSKILFSIHDLVQLPNGRFLFLFFLPRAILLTHQDGNRKGEHSRAQALNPLRAPQSVPCQPLLGSDELLACNVQSLLNSQVEMIPPQQTA